MVKRYEDVVKVAFRPFRNSTAHAGKPPTATWALQDTPHEIWSLDQSMNSYTQNADALLSSMLAVRGVARVLLFGFNYFPLPHEVQVMVARGPAISFASESST